MSALEPRHKETIVLGMGRNDWFLRLIVAADWFLDVSSCLDDGEMQRRERKKTPEIE